MPTYDYRCKKCQHQFEKYQPITAKAIRKCPKCGKSAVERLIGSGVGIIFKGSGFYQTDYKKSSQETKSPAPSKESSCGSGACKQPSNPSPCSSKN